MHSLSAMPLQSALESIVESVREQSPHEANDTRLLMPRGLRGQLAHADALRPQLLPGFGPNDPPPVMNIKVVSLDEGQKLKTGRHVVDTLTADVRSARTFGEFMDAAGRLSNKFSNTGAYKNVNIHLAPSTAGPDGTVAANTADLIVGLDESTITGSLGSEYTISGQASFQAKLGICNVFGSAETLSLDFAGAPTSFSVSDLTKLTSSDGAHSMQSAFQPSISIGLHKPTVFDSIIPMDVKLRTFSERLDPTMGFHTKVRDVEVTASDPSRTHALTYAASWRNIIPLMDHKSPFGTFSSPEVVAHTSASLKSSLAYSFLRNRIVGSALPASGYKLAATTEVAGLGGDVQHLRATSSAQAAMSFGRYMPDTGYQMPLSKATYLAQWNGTLPPEDTKALAAQRASLHPNPQSNSLLDVDIIRPPRRDAMSDFTTSASESGLPPTDRAELFLRTEKGVTVAHSAFEPEFPVAARLQGWLSSGVTLLADARVGGIWSFGGDRGVAGGSRLCDRFFMTGLSMRGFESVGPKAAPKPGGTPYGDALGGNLVATATVRCLLPPPLPSVRLTNAGMRTQVFGTVGTLGGVGASTLQLDNVSAAVGVGLVMPVAAGVSLEANYTFWHRKQTQDVTSSLRIQLMV